MANKYWAAGVSGNWNSILSWSDFATGTPAGAVVPGTGDAVFFNAASGTVTATLDISPVVQSVTCTGFTGTLAFGTNTISLNSTGTIFTGATTMTVTGTPQIICTNSSATTRTITPTAVTEANSISFRITAGTGTFNCSAGAIRDIDFTDGTNPTGFGGQIATFAVTIYGNFKASTNMTASSSANTFTFAATSGTKTINTAGVTFDRQFTFNGVGGTWQLQAALTSGATRTCTLTNGTLDLNGYTLTTGIFSSNNSNTRTLAFKGYESITLTGRNTTVYNTSNSTGFTVTYSNLPNDNLVILDAAGILGETRSILTGLTSSGGTEFNINNIVIAQGADIINFGTSPSVFRSITFFSPTFTGSLAANAAPQIYGEFFLLSSAMTVTGGTNAWTFLATYATTLFETKGLSINTPITVNTNSSYGVTLLDALNIGSTNALTFISGTLKLYRSATSVVGSLVTTGTTQKFLSSSTPGTQATISAASGTNTVTYLTIKDSNATGGATWDANNPTNVNAGNNTGWIFFPTPANSNEITMRLRSFTQPRRF